MPSHKAPQTQLWTKYLKIQSDMKIIKICERFYKKTLNGNVTYMLNYVQYETFRISIVPKQHDALSTTNKARKKRSQ